MVLQPVDPVPDWAAWARHPGLYLRRLDPVSPGTSMMLQVYRTQHHGVMTTGRVVPTGEFVSPETVGASNLLPVVVDVWGGVRSGAAPDSACFFVFGAHQPWPFDPRPWLVGSHPVLTLSASAAAQTVARHSALGNESRSYCSVT